MKKISIHEKRQRDARWEKFNQNILPVLGFYFDVSHPNPAAYIAHDTPKGNLTIYPKGDKIQLQNGSWVNGNISEWITKNILHDCDK